MGLDEVKSALPFSIRVASESLLPLLDMHLPKKDPLSAQAWLEGKLFVGLMIERMVDAAATFFPWGYPVETTPQPAAGD